MNVNYEPRLRCFLNFTEEVCNEVVLQDLLAFEYEGFFLYRLLERVLPFVHNHRRREELR